MTDKTQTPLSGRGQIRGLLSQSEQLITISSSHSLAKGYHRSTSTWKGMPRKKLNERVVTSPMAFSQKRMRFLIQVRGLGFSDCKKHFGELVLNLASEHLDITSLSLDSLVEERSETANSDKEASLITGRRQYDDFPPGTPVLTGRSATRMWILFL